MLTQTDEGFLFLCGKKKCVKGIYEMLKPEQAKEDFISQHTHNPLEWQGRSQEQIEANFFILSMSVLVFLSFLVIYGVWFIFS
jgi:hypothetical protein